MDWERGIESLLYSALLSGFWIMPNYYVEMGRVEMLLDMHVYGALAEGRLEDG
jgi:hypothetical protein